MLFVPVQTPIAICRSVEEIDEDIISGDSDQYCIVRWMTSSDVVKRLVDLFRPIWTFFGRKREDLRTTGRH